MFLWIYLQNMFPGIYLRFMFPADIPWDPLVDSHPNLFAETLPADCFVVCSSKFAGNRLADPNPC